MSGRLARLREVPRGERSRLVRDLAASTVLTRWYRLRYRRVTFGVGVRVSGRLTVKGRGRVVVGARTHIDGADIITGRPWATVTIGADCYLNGPELRAWESITVGDRSILASALVVDTDFHPLQRDRLAAAAAGAEVPTDPVVIEDDVWLGARSAVLKGVRIGTGSVVGLGAIVRSDVAPGTVVVPPTPTERPLAE